MVKTSNAPQVAATGDAIVPWAGPYDLLIWLLTLGRERRFRERLLAPARLRAGESVLDVGCGTGTLAILAKTRVGETGSVYGIDPSMQMIARATRKAEKANVDATFEYAVAQSLPFAEARFDVVLNTVMLHHLRRTTRQEAVREMRRVLKPGGRLLAVDFGAGADQRRGLLGHIHGHSGIKPHELRALVTNVGMEIVEGGPLGVWDLQFVLATAPRA